jgi:hypothetical protein
MDSSRADPIALAETRLRWLDRRQQVLSRNIANANTPNFTAFIQDSRDDYAGILSIRISKLNSGTTHIMRSREYVTEAQRPLLTVVWDPPAAGGVGAGTNTRSGRSDRYIRHARHPLG